MSESLSDPGLFAFAQLCFRNFLEEFAHYGIESDPGLQLRQGNGMLCYYDMKDRQIYLSLPNLSEPVGKLHMLFLRSLLGCESQDELWQFFYLLIPHVIAHELAHHFRHRYGQFTDNLWYEEQVANQLAVAVTKHRLTPDEKTFARKVLPRAIESLSVKMESKHIAADSYHNILHALNVSGQIGDAALENIEMVHKYFAVKPEDILKGTGQLSPEILERLEQRDDIIDSINDEYASDAIRYIYYHIGWLYLALTGRETQYVEEFARAHLNRRAELLPLVGDDEADPDEKAVQACFKAYRETISISETGSRYFYKRYRRLLLSKLQAMALLAPSQREQLKEEAGALLEMWRGREKESDALIYLAQLAPPALRRLFPQVIGEHLDPGLSLLRDLPTPTDARLWRRLVLRDEDAGAANTLHRLALLDQADIFRPLPAEVMLEITHNLCRVRLDTGEMVIWEGEVNDDVYLLVAGELEVGVMRERAFTRFDAIQPGEVFGEMAFFTREPRKAAVRAARPSECFVLKGSDLRLFAFKHPSILMQIAGVLARRLANFIKTKADGPTR
ncbi:MAG: cyclic nucleotide-binding domain-containing protein [Anaerolineales bacterium]